MRSVSVWRVPQPLRHLVLLPVARGHSAALFQIPSELDPGDSAPAASSQVVREPEQSAPASREASPPHLPHPPQHSSASQLPRDFHPPALTTPSLRVSGSQPGSPNTSYRTCEAGPRSGAIDQLPRRFRSVPTPRKRQPPSPDRNRGNLWRRSCRRDDSGNVGPLTPLHRVANGHCRGGICDLEFFPIQIRHAVQLLDELARLLVASAWR